MCFTSLVGMGENDVGFGTDEDITEDAGWVVGMYQESAMVSNCVALLAKRLVCFGVRILCSKIRELCYALMLTIYADYAPQISHYASKQSNFFK